MRLYYQAISFSGWAGTDVVVELQFMYIHDSLLCKVILQGGPFYLEHISISFHSKPSFNMYSRPDMSANWHFVYRQWCIHNI